MNFNEFNEWLKKNSRGYEVFSTKAMDLQKERNKKRTGKTKKWTDTKMERAAEAMWTDIAKNAYEKIKVEKGVPKYNGTQIWIEFMEEYNFLENFDDSMAELEF